MNRILSFLKRHAPAILSGLAAVGTVTTAVLVAKETPEVITRLQEAEEDKNDDLTLLEKVVVAGPVYLPAAGVCLSTLFCIFGANALSRHQQASLVTAYAMLEQSYKRYREKVMMLYGEEADHIVMKALDSEDDAEEEIKWDERRTFYDEYGKRFFERSEKEILLAEYHFNRNFALRGYASLNEFYEFLKLDPIPGGDKIGWSMDAGGAFYGYQWIDFEHQPLKDEISPGNDMEYITILMPFPPTADFMDPEEGYTYKGLEPLDGEVVLRPDHPYDPDNDEWQLLSSPIDAESVVPTA